MKKGIFIALCALFSYGLLSAQTNSIKNQDKFVMVSQELKEAGKNFFSVDMNYLTTDKNKNAFMELVYQESKLFPVSVIRKDNTLLVCAYEAVLNSNDAISLLNSFREKSNTMEAKTSSMDKLQTK